MQISLGDAVPQTGDASFIAHSAEIIGNVTLRAGSSVWYTAVLRADLDPIVLGERSNLQDGVVVHTDEGYPATIGAGVSVGHRAILHGCTVEDDCLIGMGSVVLNGATIGAGSLIAAGAVVPEGAAIPPRSLVAGVPGKVRRELTDSDVARIRENADIYSNLAARHARAAQAQLASAEGEQALTARSALINLRGADQLGGIVTGVAGVAEFVRAGMTVLPPGREAVTASPALINLCGADQLGEIVTDVAGVAEFVRAGMTALRRATRR